MITSAVSRCDQGTGLKSIQAEPIDHPQAQRPLPVLVRVYNDWAALAQMLCRLDESLYANGSRAEVLLVNDVSSVITTDSISAGQHRALCTIDALHLRRNLGHQRSIAIGLAHAQAETPCEAVIIMGGPEDDSRVYVIMLACVT